jgi:aldose sugar dehydrogenase
VLYTAPDNASRGEGTVEHGMLGLTTDAPDVFPTTRFVFACLVSTAPPGAQIDVRVLRFNLTHDMRLINRTDVVTGIPSIGGFHHGCRLRFGPDSHLYVTTGDSGQCGVAQNTSSLGGKVLRVGRSGAAAGGNRWGRVFNYGHRNPQGIAFRRSDGLGVQAEHGYETEDELNLVVAGNFGWDPGCPYQEAGVPMTDTAKFPDAIEALIDTGNETRAPSGIGFVEGSPWGSWNGVLLVAMLKQRELVSLKLASDGRVLDKGLALDGTYGRLRSVIQGPDGNVYVTTDNGNDSDVIVRLTPG